MISEGNIIIRKILQDNLDSYCRLGDNDKHDFVKRIVRAFSEDVKIKSDSVTGKEVGVHTYGRMYWDWKCIGAKVKKYMEPYSAALPFNRAIIDFAEEPDNIHKAYLCGITPDSTMYFLFQLCRGERLSSFTWGLEHRPNENLVRVLSGGRHRTLALMLFGENKAKPGYLLRCETIMADDPTLQ